MAVTVVRPPNSDDISFFIGLFFKLCVTAIGVAVAMPAALGFKIDIGSFGVDPSSLINKIVKQVESTTGVSPTAVGPTLPRAGWNFGGSHSIVSYDQIDPRWAQVSYGSSTVLISGCAPTSIAMVVATLTPNRVTPATVAKKYGSTYSGPDGTWWSIYPVVARDYGLKYDNLGTNLTSAIATLDRGGLVVISTGKGYFTPGPGHVMVIRLYDHRTGLFWIADSYGGGTINATEVRGYTASFLRNQGHLMGLWGYWE